MTARQVIHGRDDAINHCVIREHGVELSAKSVNKLKPEECINIIERIIITGSRQPLTSLLQTNMKSDEPREERLYTDQEIQDIEKANIRRVLAAVNGKVSGPGGAAELLGLRPTTLASRIKKYGLNTP